MVQLTWFVKNCAPCSDVDAGLDVQDGQPPKAGENLQLRVVQYSRMAQVQLRQRRQTANRLRFCIVDVAVLQAERRQPRHRLQRPQAVLYLLHGGELFQRGIYVVYHVVSYTRGGRLAAAAAAAAAAASDWSLTLASVCRNGRWRSARLKIFRCMCDSTNRSNVQPLLDHQQRHAAFKPTALRSKVAPIPLPAGSTRPASAV